MDRRVWRPGVISLSLHALLLSAAGGQQPVFRTGVDVVAVDVVVVDQDGNPALGLTPEDFLLLVDGKPRRIATIEYIPAVEAPAASGSSPPKPSPFSSNEATRPGRLVLLAIDRENIRVGEGRAAMAAAAEFVDQLPPPDRIGLFTIPPGGPWIEFSSDRGRIREALEKIVGLGKEDIVLGEYSIGLTEALAIDRRDAMALSRVVERECRDGERLCAEFVLSEAKTMALEARRKTRQCLASFLRLMERLKDIEGPKSLVLVSEGLPAAEPRMPLVSRVSADSGFLDKYLEIYPDETGPPPHLTVAFEIIDEERGDRLAHELVAMPPAEGVAGRIATASLPVESLPPGHYLARATLARDESGSG